VIPTCDGTEIIYQHSDCRLPLDLAIGDPVDFLSAGAYTASYASVEFNGFALSGRIAFELEPHPSRPAAHRRRAPGVAISTTSPRHPQRRRERPYARMPRGNNRASEQVLVMP
jgi:hypothetical protein